MNIVLTGPMGAGKTEVGKLAAAMLGREFADTDTIVEDMAGSSIGQIFAGKGQEYFRELEKTAIETVSNRDNLVIATGGGAVLSPVNMRRLRLNGVIITLDAPITVLLKRLESSGERPLLASGKNRRGEFEKYLEQRIPYYANTDFRVDTGELTINETAKKVCDIAKLPVIRICGCISGKNAEADMRIAIQNGVSMMELRLDLIPNPEVQNLVRNCAVPVIATDRKNSENLKKAIMAGCEFVDVDFSCPEKEEIISRARQNNCRIIVSFHDMDGVPKSLPEKGLANYLKIAATLNTPEELKKLVWLHGGREDVIIAGMGPLGGLLRVFGPLLGSYLTYCSVGEQTATGQMDLETMNGIYRGMKLR